MRRTISFLVAVWVLGIHAVASAYDSREVVREIATLIENNYFDVERGTKVARELRSDARSGVFDRHREARDLAAELTARLRSADRHFTVMWFQGAPATAESTTSNATSTFSFGGQSYGFRTVAMLPGGIGYLDIRSFSYFSPTRPDDPARLAADAALQLVSDASAVILDLRNSIGGYSHMASYIVSAFTAADADVFNVVHRRDGTESERPRQHRPNPRTNVPVYVLVSGSTASAAESAAYTLQAADRAVIVGERTSGAANPGGMFPVRDGFNVFISIGTPINPITRSNWEGVGVVPDVSVPAEQALQHAQRLALEKLREAAGGAANLERKWALEALVAQENPPRGLVLPEYIGRYGDAEISLANGTLHLQRSRRAMQTLAPLRTDEFFIAGEPTQRLMFERDTAGRIRGFQLMRSSAYSTWFPRTKE